jgi:hypothetical protein
VRRRGKGFLLEPDSRGIRIVLNRICANKCTHGLTECFRRCGVRRVGMKWEVITAEERYRWLKEGDSGADA